MQGAATNAFPHDIRYRIYDRPGTGNDVLLVDSFVTIPGLSTNKFFTDVLPVLADGVHNLKLEAEDRAGNVNDFLLQITIDTVAPPVSFGLAAVANDGLDPDSDSGVEGVPDTFVDRITNVTRPTFWGMPRPTPWSGCSTPILVVGSFSAKTRRFRWMAISPFRTAVGASRRPST